MGDKIKNKDMTTQQIFRNYNFLLLQRIMDVEPGVIYFGSVIDPRSEVFDKPIKPAIYTNN